jgi:hypothetical protein
MDFLMRLNNQNLMGKGEETGVVVANKMQTVGEHS